VYKENLEIQFYSSLRE